MADSVQATLDRPAHRSRLARIGGVAAIALAVAIGALISQTGPPGDPIPAWLGIAALLTLPGAIALIGVQRNAPVLILVAGGLCVVQSFLAMSGVTLAFLVPAILLLGSVIGARFRPVDLLAGAIVVVAWAGGWFARLTDVQERCWPIPGGLSCSSGVPTTAATATILALVALAAFAASLTPRANGRR